MEKSVNKITISVDGMKVGEIESWTPTFSTGKTSIKEIYELKPCEFFPCSGSFTLSCSKTLIQKLSLCSTNG